MSAQTIKVKNGEIMAMREPLQKLLEVKLPVRTTLKLVQVAHKLNDIIVDVDNVRNKLIKEYGSTDEHGRTSVKETIEEESNGVMLVKPNPNYEKFLTEFSELLGQEVDISFDKVKLPEVIPSTCDKCNHNMDKPLVIEASILLALERFIEV